MSKATTAGQLKALAQNCMGMIAKVAAMAVEALEELDQRKADSGHTHTAKDVGALPSSGGTLTGNLTGKYITGTWLQTTVSGHLNAASTRIPVLDASGWLYYRTPAEILADIGGASKPLKGSFTIPASGWGTDSTTGYTRYYDIAVSGVTASDRADVIIAPESVNAAADCGLCSVCETLEGKIRLRAVSAPAESMAANYWIEKGM